MKINTLKTLALLALVGAITACSTFGTDYRMKYDNSDVNLAELKQGTACLTKGSMTGWQGDATVSAAAKQGGISTVRFVKHVNKSDSSCVVVYGN